MGDPVEVELKLEYEPADRERLTTSPLLGADAAGPERLSATYFDTPDLQLLKAGYSLRIRKERNRRIQTVKTSDRPAAGLFVRGEWERPVRGNKPVFDARTGPPGQLLDASTVERIAPIFVTDIERHMRACAFGSTLIEISIDSGAVRAGQLFTPISELELELKSGSPRGLFDLARSLSEDFPLRLGVQSKSALGYALVGGVPAAAERAEPLRLDPEIGVGETFVAIANNCIRHYRLNEALLLRNDAVEAVHQARVAIRRLRSAVSLFKPLFASDQMILRLAAELRWLAAELGHVRDIDVLLPKLDAPARIILTAERDRSFARLRLVLESARVRLLPIYFAEWLALSQWKCGPADPTIRDENIYIFAADRLDRLGKRLRREGRGLADVDDKHRHEVRKTAKQMRYATEFLVSLYPGRKPRRRIDLLLGRIEALQDRLGQLNDIAAAPELIARLGLDIDLPTPGRKERKRLLAAAEDCFEALMATKRFWEV